MISDAFAHFKAAEPAKDKQARRRAVDDLGEYAERAVVMAATAGWGSEDHFTLEAALRPVLGEVIPVGTVLETAGWPQV